MGSTFYVPNDSLLQQMSDELSEANIIIQKVFEKYKLKFGDIKLLPDNGNVSIAIVVSNLLNNKDTASMSSLLNPPQHHS